MSEDTPSKIDEVKPENDSQQANLEGGTALLPEPFKVDRLAALASTLDFVLMNITRGPVYIKKAQDLLQTDIEDPKELKKLLEKALLEAKETLRSKDIDTWRQQLIALADTPDKNQKKLEIEARILNAEEQLSLIRAQLGGTAA